MNFYFRLNFIYQDNTKSALHLAVKKEQVITDMSSDNQSFDLGQIKQEVKQMPYSNQTQPDRSNDKKIMDRADPQNNNKAGYQYDDSPNAYYDNNWASGILMDGGNEMLYNMEFPPGELQNTNNSNQIIHNIQYQNNAHSHNINNKNMLTGDNPTINPYAGYGNIDVIQSQPQLQQQQQHQTPPQFQQIQQPSIQTNTTVKNTKQRRPCDHCRRRKIKCVLIPNTNNCVQCESKSLTCTFVGQATKRKTVTESEADNVQKKDMALHFHNKATPPVPNDGRIIPPNIPIRDVPPVQDYSMMSNSLLKKTLSLQFPRSSFYVGPTSYLYDVHLLNLIINSQNQNTQSNTRGNNNKIEQVNLNNTISLRKVSDKVQFVLKDDQSPQSYQTMSSDVDSIEKFVAPHGQILIDLYFRIIHPSYPILHKRVFLEKYSRTHREFSAPLLAAVYVLAIQWWDYDPQLNKYPKPNVDMILKIGLNNYLLEILKRPKLSAVQAGLLLLQCRQVVLPPSNNENNESGESLTDSNFSEWVLCSQVVSLAEELGLGLDCNHWKLPKWERGLRKRLAWATFMEEKWLALKNSRPSHIHPSNWVVVPLVEDDFPEKHGDGDLKEGSSDIDNGKKIFMYLIELSTILSDIMTEFYSMKAIMEVNDVHKVLKIAKPIQIRLRNWYHSLPSVLQMTSVQPRKLCSNGYLQLAYFATELTLHRRIITCIYEQTQSGALLPPELVKVCRSAARTRLLAAIEFVRDLKPEHIHSFWHSSATSNFTLIGTFASLLFISSSSKEEADFFKEQVFNYRWILKISSKGFDQVGDALKKLDMVLNYIPGLLNDSADLPIVIPNVSSASSGLEHAKAPVSSANEKSSPTYPHQPPGNIGTNPSQFKRAKLNHINYRFNNQSSNNPPYEMHSFMSNSQNPSAFTRESHLMNNSPHSSQGLSPKEIIELQKQAVSNTSGTVSSPMKQPDSKPNSPAISRSPATQSTTSLLQQVDTESMSDARSHKSDKES